MASAISQSSAGTVVEDLVSDRSIPLKVCMIVLNSAQLISCWAAVAYFIKTYESWSLTELALSIALLFAGNYLIPGIANAVIYGRRWKRSQTSNRQRTQEENKQAWVCLRIALSLLGLPTVGRYIETIIVSKKLNNLENLHVKESVITHKEGSRLNPTSGSKIGSTMNQLKSIHAPKNNSANSAMTHASSTNALSGNNQAKVRKARRQYRRCEHDGAWVALISGSAGAGPMAIGLLFLYFQRVELRKMASDQMAVVFTSIALNILWLAATLTHFYPAKHISSEAEFERGVGGINVGAMILLYCSHLIQVTTRIVCFSVFCCWYYGYVLIPIVFHWLLGTFLLVGYRAYMKSHVANRPLGDRVSSATVSFLSALFFGYVGIFDFVNGNEGKTRMRYLIYYFFYWVENIAMLASWIVRFPSTQIQFPIPFVGSILGLFWMGFILFQLYLFCFSSSPYGTSVLGLCCKKSHRRGNYAEEVREPVFGVPVSQSAVPFWNVEQHEDGGPESRVGSSKNPQMKPSKPKDLNNGATPSIMSYQSPSIYSQPSSQINFSKEKPKQKPPPIKQPPVVQQKARLAYSKPLSPLSTTTDSSSSGEEFAVFSAKTKSLTKSQPDLFVPHSEPSSSEDEARPKFQKGQRPATKSPGANPRIKSSTPSHSEHEPNSRSLDNISGMVPSSQPSANTKRIGMPAAQSNAKGTFRPLPTKDQVKRSHNNRDPRSLPARRH